jgi:hypothetical protein
VSRSFGHRAVVFPGLPACPRRRGRSFSRAGPEGIGSVGTIDHLNLLHDVAEKWTVTVLPLMCISPKMILLDLPCSVDSGIDGG